MLARIIYEDSWGDQKIEGITPGMFPVVVEHLAKNGVEMTVEFYDEYNKSTDDLSVTDIIYKTRDFITELMIYGFTYLQVSDPVMSKDYEADHQLYFCNDSYYKVGFEPDEKYYIVCITRDGLTLKIDYIDQDELLEKMQPRDCFVNNIIAENFCCHIHGKELFDSKIEDAKSQLNFDLLDGATTDKVEELIETNFTTLVAQNRYFDNDICRYDENVDSYVSPDFDEDDVFGYEKIKSKLNELIDDSFDGNFAIYVRVCDHTSGALSERTVHVSSIRSSSIDSLCGYGFDYRWDEECEKDPSLILKYTKVTKDGNEIVRYAEINEVYHKYPILLNAIINNDFSGFDDQPQHDRIDAIHIIDDESFPNDSMPNYYKDNCKPNTLVINLFPTN